MLIPRASLRIEHLPSKAMMNYIHLGIDFQGAQATRGYPKACAPDALWCGESLIATRSNAMPLLQGQK
jgi:hypothetical protein